MPGTHPCWYAFPRAFSTTRTAVLSALVIALTASALLAWHGVAPANAQTCSWSGNWDAGIFGALHLSQDGTNITGGYSYTGSDGSNIVGQVVVYVVDNSTAAGAWQQSNNPNPGGLVWTMASDCNSFTGQYANPSTPTGSWDGSWNATRSS